MRRAGIGGIAFVAGWLAGQVGCAVREAPCNPLSIDTIPLGTFPVAGDDPAGTMTIDEDGVTLDLAWPNGDTTQARYRPQGELTRDE